MTRRPGTRETRRQASNIPPPAQPRPPGEEARHRPAGRSGPVTAPAGRRPSRPADKGGGGRGPAARTHRAGWPVCGRPVGTTHSGENGKGKTGRAGQRYHGDPGTATADPRRLRGRSSSRRPSPGNSGSRGRPCKVLSPVRNAPPQDGAIDGRAPKAVRHALEFETARFRCDDGRRRPRDRSSAKIQARHCATGSRPTRAPAACRKK